MGGSKAEARLKDSRDKWKSKSRQKAAINKRDQKRIKELTFSLDLWTQRYLEQKQQSCSSGVFYEHIADESVVIGQETFVDFRGKS
jgi:hypothetical protein